MNENKKNAVRYIDDNSAVFTDLSDKIWENPELSLKEFESARSYIEVLEKEGFEIVTNLGGIEAAFSATYGHGHPIIGFLGEYDALAGLSQKKGMTEPSPIVEGGAGHGCGHNMLGTGDLAAAFAVKNYLQNSGSEGTVIFYGCPGEEGGAAKAFLAREGEWAKLDAALTWHPEDVNEVATGTNNSTIQVLYEFEGIAAHAAGDPQNGRSALDAVELMNTGVQYLREHTTDDCRIHYAMIDGGGVSPNVVQAHASVLYMVRANKVRDTVKLLKRVEKCADGAALMTETSYKRTFIDGTAELVPNYVLEEVLHKNFSEIELPEYTEEELAFARKLHETCPVCERPGRVSRLNEDAAIASEKMSENGTRPINDFLLPLVHSTGFVPGSSDVGDVSWLTPTAQIHTAGFVSGTPGHSWQAVSCGGTTIGHKALLLAGKVLACAAIDLYEQPQILEKAKAEFEDRTRSGYVCPIEEGAVPIAL